MQILLLIQFKDNFVLPHFVFYYFIECKYNYLYAAKTTGKARITGRDSFPPKPPPNLFALTTTLLA